MDQTTKPLLIPPDFALYSEKHGIFELYQVKLLKLDMNFEISYQSYFKFEENAKQLDYS